MTISLRNDLSFLSHLISHGSHLAFHLHMYLYLHLYIYLHLHLNLNLNLRLRVRRLHHDYPYAMRPRYYRRTVLRAAHA